MWRLILAAILVVGAIIVLRQISGAQQDTAGKVQQDSSSKAPQDTSSNEEVEICRGTNSYTYQIDGKRYALPFEVIGDQAVVEGDIVIGQAADVLKEGTNHVTPIVPDYVRGEPTRWEGNLVPYVIDASVTASDRVLIEQAITAWQRATNVRFKQLSNTRDWQHENYVKFSGRINQCTSNSLGIKQRPSSKVNEEDNINVVQVAGCAQNWGRIAHEIGHVLGLGHEHSRGNRDNYITTLWSNIDSPKQFCRVIWDQPTLANSSYDYDSIMHYAPDQAARRSSGCRKVIYDGKEDCLAFLPNKEKLEQQRQTLRSNIKPGQRDHLSEGDIAHVNLLYPASPPDPSPTQPCVRSTTTTVKVGDRTTTTTKTEPCSPGSQRTVTEQRPARPPCCGNSERTGSFCGPAACPAVRVSWPRSDRWCRPGRCRPWPRRHCDGWFEARWERPRFADWDDRW
jgi:hypothetical protein